MRSPLWFAITALALSLSGTAFAETLPVLPGAGASIREVTLEQVFRYGREMYRRGNHPEAIEAFKQMLAIDCTNEPAQYHLMKIARKSPQYKDLDAYLKSLNCPVHDFNEEDFLPASLYYETDAELMQEQLILYNKRYRIAKASLEESASSYGGLTKELEEEITSLRQQLMSPDRKTPAENTELNQKLSDGINTAARMDSQVSELQAQLANERQQHQKELATLRKDLKRYPEPDSDKDTGVTPEDQTVTIITAKDESIAGLKERLARELSGTAQPLPIPLAQPSPAILAKPPADTAREIATARAQLQDKERALEAKDRALATLQEKFEDIQKRLRIIQASVGIKNAQIKALESDINNLHQ